MEDEEKELEEEDRRARDGKKVRRRIWNEEPTE
jgi:hypothetical protein